MNLRSIKFTLFFYLFIFFTSIISAQISGTVFRDFNSNGVKDNTSTFNEPFVSGITVTAFPASGLSQTTTTNSSGTYSFTGLTLPVRIEFSGYQTGDFPGPVGSSNSSSVQFYSAATSTANFGVNYPSDYSNPANIKLFTPVYTNGDPLLGGSSGQQRGLIAVAHSAAVADPYSMILNSSQIGSSWGIAYHKSSKKLFVASFLKRHFGLGSGGLGQIYSVNTTTNAVSSLLNLTTDYGISVGTVNRSANPLPGDTAVANYDLDAFGKVGTVGLGGIDLSENDKYLFVANLFDRQIYVFDVGLNATKPPVYTTLSLSSVTCTGGQARPWAIKYYRGAIYVGVICTAENSENPAHLFAKVIKYSFDQSTGIAGAPSEILSFPLRGTAVWGPNEIKGPLTTDFYNGIPPTDDPDFARWQNWATDVADYSYFLNPASIGQTGGLRYWAQPILSDLEFDVDGSMILGFTDRLGNQMGLRNYEPDASSNALKSGVSGGDIYRACFNASTGQYTLESNGNLSQCGLTSAGGANTHGPGGGEFYYQDGLPFDTNADHSEGVMGALALIPGYGQVISTQMGITWSTQNNQNWWSGGFNWYSNQDGSRDRAYLVYRSPVPEANSGNPKASFGKANGLGDLEVVTDPAPIEIGNRVWMDTDNDGVQDADEMGLDGIAVKLFNGASLISTKTTANGGQYYFTTADGVLPNTSYTIRIEAASIPSGKSVTLKDQPTGGVQDLGDNDASLVGGNADISYTTGNAGENNHTFDFGFSASPACTPSCLLNASFFQDVILGYDGNTYTYEGQGNNGSCSLDGPYDMSIGPDGNLYITSSVTNTVLKYDIGTVTCQGTFISAGSGGLNNPRGLTFLPNGDLLVNSHNSGQILRYNGTTGASMGVFSNGSDITPGAASMAPHMNIKVGPDGAVWVADHSNNRVLRFNASTGAFISTFAQLPNGTGVRSFEFVGNIVLISGHNLDEVYSYSYTSGMQLSIFADASEGLDGPTGITYGPDGKVYIGSLNSNKILVFDISGTKVGEITANSPKDIVFKCGECFSSSCMVSATASPGNCNPANNQYNVTGQVTLTNPPSSGTVTVQIVGGGSQTFTLPQTSPISYSIAGQTADGSSHTVTAVFSDDLTCQSSITYTAPISCLVEACSSNVTATPGSCNTLTNQYSLTGQITLTNPPLSGDVTVQIVGGLSQTFNLPLATSPISYTFNNLTADGASHTVNVTISGVSCASTINYTAPVSCTIICPSPNCTTLKSKRVINN